MSNRRIASIRELRRIVPKRLAPIFTRPLALIRVTWRLPLSQSWVFPSGSNWCDWRFQCVSVLEPSQVPFYE